jgi:hypothetical protein
MPWEGCTIDQISPPVRVWLRADEDGVEDGVVDGVEEDGDVVGGVDEAVTPVVVGAADAIPPRPSVRVAPTRPATVSFRIVVIAAPSK